MLKVFSNKNSLAYIFIQSVSYRFPASVLKTCPSVGQSVSANRSCQRSGQRALNFPAPGCFVLRVVFSDVPYLNNGENNIVLFFLTFTRKQEANRQHRTSLLMCCFMPIENFTDENDLYWSLLVLLKRR